MANNQNLRPFQKGKQGGPGRPPGKLNKATVAKMVLELVSKYPDAVYEKLVKRFPWLPKEVDGEFMLYVAQLDKAIRQNDTTAAKFLTDQAYGKNPLDGEDGAVLDGADKIVIVYKKEYLESDPLD